MQTDNLNAMTYESEVQRRLEHVTAYLRDIQTGQSASVLLPLWSLRALQDKSRQVGLRELSLLCHRMEIAIMSLQLRGGAAADAALAEIAADADAIRDYAHRAVVGSRMPHGDVLLHHREVASA